jgi:hypothetical protein
MGETQRHGLAIRGHAASAGAWPEGAEAEEHHEMIRRLILLWANVKYWWETRHERAAYRRLFRDRAVRTHPTTSNGYKPAPDRDVNG